MILLYVYVEHTSLKQTLTLLIIDILEVVHDLGVSAVHCATTVSL